MSEVTLPDAAVTAADESMVVASRAEAALRARPPLLILDEIVRLLDAHGIGAGPATAKRVGNGLSHITFRIQREGATVILRRPPRPPLAPGAHDVLREARVLQCIRSHGVRVPRVLVVHDSDDLLGVPFYVMEAVTGEVLSDGAPPEFWSVLDPVALMDEFVAGLAEIHAVPVPALEFMRKASQDSFAARQLNRWTRTWKQIHPRDIPDIETVGRWLAEHAPANGTETLMHGDYRFANLMFTANPRMHLAAVLDWEMASLGDPLFDLAYTLAFYPIAGDDEGLLPGSSAFVRSAGGYPGRAHMIAEYEKRSGRRIEGLDWYLAASIWRTAIGLESLYQRELRGSGDIGSGSVLKDEVPRLAARALAAMRGRFPLD